MHGGKTGGVTTKRSVILVQIAERGKPDDNPGLLGSIFGKSQHSAAVRGSHQHCLIISIDPGPRAQNFALHLDCFTCSCSDELRRHHGRTYDSSVGGRAREDSGRQGQFVEFLSISRGSCKGRRSAWSTQSACKARRCRTPRSYASAVR